MLLELRAVYPTRHGGSIKDAVISFVECRHAVVFRPPMLRQSAL